MLKKSYHTQNNRVHNIENFNPWYDAIRSGEQGKENGRRAEIGLTKQLARWQKWPTIHTDTSCTWAF